MADCFVGAETSFRRRSLQLVHNKHAMRAHRMMRFLMVLDR